MNEVLNVRVEAIEETCLRCACAEVRVIDDGSDGAPLFACQDCGFEWGEAVAELMR